MVQRIIIFLKLCLRGIDFFDVKMKYRQLANSLLFKSECVKSVFENLEFPSLLETML